MIKLLFAASILLFMGCGHPDYKDPHVMIYTSLGDIEVEVYTGKAPVSGNAFLSYVDSGFYTNSSFYRVVMEEGATVSTNTGLIQGGIYQSDPKQYAATPGIAHEPTSQTGLSHTSGILSLARTAIGTANTEFFICIGNQAQFDEGKGQPEDGKGFAAFGKVFKGMDIVRKIQAQRSSNESFEEKITIYKISRL